MARLVQFPRSRIVNNSIRVIPGAKAYLYESGTTTPLITYGDSALSAAQPWPVVADAYGVFRPIYLADSVTSYKIKVTNNSDAELWTEDAVPVTAGGGGSTSTGSNYPQTATEITAGVTPVNEAYPEGNILRYGADPTGALPSDSAFVLAFAVAAISGVKVYVPGTPTYYRTETQLTVPENVTVYGDGYRSQIRQFSIEKNGFNLSSKSAVRSLYLVGTGATTYAPTAFGKYAGVFAQNCVNVTVDGIYASGWVSAGIHLRECTNYKIVDNTLFQQSVADDLGSAQSDILIYSLTAGARGIISRNGCYSNTRAAGIFVDANGNDSDITVSDNIIVPLNASWGIEADPKRRHGICASYDGAGDGTSGGRVVISGNVIRNCLMTGIYRASGNPAGPLQPVLITGNLISFVGNGAAEPSLCGGIFISNGGAGDEITNNVVETFRGVLKYGNAGIVVSCTFAGNPGYVRVTGNRVQNSSGHGLLLANNIRNAYVTGNAFNGNLNEDIAISHTPGDTTTGGHIIKNNIIRRFGSSIPAIFVSSQAGLVPIYIEGNWIYGANKTTSNSWNNAGVYLSTGATPAFVRNNTITNCYVGVNVAAAIPTGRGSMPDISNNSFYKLNTAVRAVGATADTLCCVRNTYKDMDAANCVVNAFQADSTEGTGFVITGTLTTVQYGTWIKGDRVVNDNPVTGQPTGWVCTVAGNYGGTPATWKGYGTIL